MRFNVYYPASALATALVFVCGFSRVEAGVLRIATYNIDADTGSPDAGPGLATVLQGIGNAILPDGTARPLDVLALEELHYDNPATSSTLQFVVDSQRPMLAEVALLLQLPTQVEDVVLQLGVGAVGGPASTPRQARPIDAVQALPGAAFDPALDRGQADLEVAGDGAHRLALANRLDHLAPLLFEAVFSS